MITCAMWIPIPITRSFRHTAYQIYNSDPNKHLWVTVGINHLLMPSMDITNIVVMVIIGYSTRYVIR